MHCATHTLLVSCSRFNYGFGVSFAISSRVPSHSWAQLSQGLSTKSPPVPSMSSPSPSSMSSAPLSVPFNLFCQLVRHSASVSRALLHFFFFLLIVVAAAEMSPLFLGLFSTFSLRLFGLLRHFEGRPPRYAPAPVVPVRPPVVCPSAQPLPPAIIRLASRTLSYRCFPVFNSCSPLRLSSSPGGHLPGPLHQIAYHFDDGTDNIKGLTDSKEGGKSEFLKN